MICAVSDGDLCIKSADELLDLLCVMGVVEHLQDVSIELIILPYLIGQAPISSAAESELHLQGYSSDTSKIVSV